MTLVNLILVGVLIFLFVIMAFSLGIAATPHKNVILENTLPPDKLTAPETLALAKEYKKRLWLTAGLCTLLSPLILLPAYESVMMTLFWLLLLLPLAAFYGIEILYIRKMAALKAAMGWRLAVEPIMVDTQLTATKNRQLLNIGWLLPPLLATVALVIWLMVTDPDGSLIMSVTALCGWLLALGCWYSVKRLPVAAPTDDSEVNRRYNDLTKNGWSKVAVAIAYGIVALFAFPTLAMSLSGTSAKIVSFLFFLAVFGGIFWCIGFLLALRKKQDALLARTEDFRYAGEDRYWRFGVYINPNDRRLMVPDRIGLNISMNLGRPAGKIVMSLIGLLLVGAMAMTLLPTYMMDFTKEPFTGEIKNGEIRLSAPLSGSSEIPISQLQKVELTEKLHGNVLRTNGYSGAYYQIGRFTVDGKQAVCYLDERSKPFLHLVTKERDYYFTFKDPAATRTFFEELRLAQTGENKK